PRRDEPAHAGREVTQQRAHAGERDTADERRPAAIAVGERARQQHAEGERNQVRGDGELDGARRHVEVRGDLRQRRQEGVVAHAADGAAAGQQWDERARTDVHARGAGVRSDATHADVLEFRELEDAVLAAFTTDAAFFHATEGRDLGGDEAGVETDD